MELTDLQTAIVVCVYLFGVISCRFATQFFEVCHAARLVERTMYHCLLMCAKIHEDAALLQEIKYKTLKEANWDKKQIDDFKKVDKKVMENWKDSIIHSILINIPNSFFFVAKFATWKEAMQQLDDMHKESL